MPTATATFTFTFTVTVKGQVTIPVEVRERLGFEAGTRVEFVLQADGTWQFVAAGGSVASIRAYFQRPARPRQPEGLRHLVRSQHATRTGPLENSRSDLHSVAHRVALWSRGNCPPRRPRCLCDGLAEPTVVARDIYR